MLPNARQGRDVEKPNALHRLCQHRGWIRGSERVPQLAPVHGAAVGKDDLAVDAQRRVALDLGSAENKREDVEICRNPPEDIEIRVRGQISQAGEMLPQQAAEGVVSGKFCKSR